MLMSSSRNIVLHRKSSFHPTRKRVGFTPQFITSRQSKKYFISLVLYAIICAWYMMTKEMYLYKIDENWGGLTFPGGHVEKGESFVALYFGQMKPS